LRRRDRRIVSRPLVALGDEESFLDLFAEEPFDHPREGLVEIRQSTGWPAAPQGPSTVRAGKSVRS